MIKACVKIVSLVGFTDYSTRSHLAESGGRARRSSRKAGCGTCAGGRPRTTILSRWSDRTPPPLLPPGHRSGAGGIGAYEMAKRSWRRAIRGSGCPAAAQPELPFVPILTCVESGRRALSTSTRRRQEAIQQIARTCSPTASPPTRPGRVFEFTETGGTCCRRQPRGLHGAASFRQTEGHRHRHGERGGFATLPRPARYGPYHPEAIVLAEHHGAGQYRQRWTARSSGAPRAGAGRGEILLDGSSTERVSALSG